MLHTVIFIGRSGCGKGTQAALLKERITKYDADKHPILHVETGDRFRKFIRSNTYSSELSRKIYESDARQPDFLAAYMWGGELIEELHEGMHIVFDGVARSELEARMLTTALEFYQRERPVIVHIDVSRRWSEERLLARGRSDDLNLAKIDKRLDWFDKDVTPAIEYFKSNPYYKVLSIDGEQTIDEVHREIVAKWNEL